MSPLVLLPLLVLGQTHSRWEASVRAEVRARTASPQDDSTVAAADAELRPSLSGAIFNGPWTLSGSYRPTFRSREFYSPRVKGQAIGEHSHVGQVEAVWVKEASARAFIGQFVNYGTLDLSTLTREPGSTGAATPTPTPQIPAVRTGLGVVRELTFDTTAGVDWYLTRRVTLTTTAGFTYGGGADVASRASLPLGSTWRGGARLAWLASVRDTLAINLAAQYVRFFQVAATPQMPVANPGARIVIAELSGFYARVLGERTGADLVLGATATFGQLPNLDPMAMGTFRSASGVAPLVGVGLNHRVLIPAQQLDFRIGGQLAPFVDRFAGTVYQRLEGNVSLAWRHVRHVSASIGAGVSRSIPGGTEAPLTTVFGDAGIGYAGDPWWRVDLTGRTSLNQAGTPALPSPLPAPMPPAAPAWSGAPALEKQWVVGLSLTLIAASEQPRTFRE